MNDSDPVEPSDSDTADKSVRFQAADDETPMEAVIRGVATLDNLEPKSSEPLYDVVDPDALNGLFHERDTKGCIKFRYDGYSITYRSDDSVIIRGAQPTDRD